MIKLFDYELSGNCYKVRLILSLLGLEYELIPVNFLEREHKLQNFLELNPFGQLPVLMEGDLVIRDSQAILVYLARRTGGEDWFPLEAESMGKVIQWLSTAANEIQHGPASARLHFVFSQAMDINHVQQTDRSKISAYSFLGVINLSKAATEQRLSASIQGRP